MSEWPSKICENCGKEYLMKPYSSIAVFRKRKYCSHKCAIEKQRESKHWREGYIGSNKTVQDM